MTSPDRLKGILGHPKLHKRLKELPLRMAFVVRLLGRFRGASRAIHPSGGQELGISH